MKEYINDLKTVLFVLAAVIVAIIYNWNYFFSDETLNEVKVVQKEELEKGLEKMKDFKPHTQEELKELGVKEGRTYAIEYLNKDYFNGEETLEKSRAKAIMNDGNISFIVSDPYGMDKFINNAKVIKA